MSLITIFAIAFAFSFVGSIPPGTINISVIQLSLNKKFAAALRFALAAALIEYPYALIAVVFESWITNTPFVVDYFQLIGGSVMILLGVINLWSAVKPNKWSQKLQDSGFRKGLVISLLNPLAIPFWIGVTAYVKSNGWVELAGNGIYIYVLGVSLGTFALLLLVAILAKKVAPVLQESQVVQKLPGVVFIMLGVYTLWKYLI